MAGWIKMPLGREVGLCQTDIVLDGNPAPPPQKWAEVPIFGPCLLWPNGWRDQDGTWHGSGPRSRPNCPRCGLNSLKNWSDKRLLKFNLEKCKVMHVGHSIPTEYMLQEDDTRIQELIRR